MPSLGVLGIPVAAPGRGSVHTRLLPRRGSVGASQVQDAAGDVDSVVTQPIVVPLKARG
jgi:hypothetical protein